MITRTYECMDCKTMFEVDHDSGDEPFPDCPNCEKVLEWRPQRFAIGGSNTSKAVKMTQDILEKDYGLTDYKDNNRMGDVGYVDPTRKSTVETEKITREVKEMTEQVVANLPPAVQGFWGGPANKGGQVNPMVAQGLMASAKAGPGAGVDAMSLLNQGVKSGKVGDPLKNFRVVARAKG